MMDLLFELPEEPIRTEKCGTCEYRQRWQCGGRVFQYCGKTLSKRTDNGLKKIKCKDTACLLYKKEKPYGKDTSQADLD